MKKSILFRRFECWVYIAVKTIILLTSDRKTTNSNKPTYKLTRGVSMFCTKAPEFETIVLSKGCMMSKKVCSLSPSCSRLSSLSYCAWKLTSLGVILYEYLTLNTSASVIPVFTRTRKIPSKDSWGFRSFLNDVKRSAFTGTAISVRGLPSFVFSRDSRSLKFKPFEVCLFVQAIYFDYNVYSSTEKCFVDHETI